MRFLVVSTVSVHVCCLGENGAEKRKGIRSRRWKGSCSEMKKRAQDGGYWTEWMSDACLGQITDDDGNDDNDDDDGAHLSIKASGRCVHVFK